MVPPTPRLQILPETALVAALPSPRLAISHQSILLQILREVFPSLESEFAAIEHSLSGGAARNFEEAFAQLAPGQVRHCHETLGSHFSSYVSLSQERDTRIFWNGLLQLAGALEESGDPQVALGLFSAVARRGEGVVAGRARLWLRNLLGEDGLSLRRFGRSLRQVVEGATDAPMLAGFVAGAGVANLARAGVGMALAARGVAPGMTRMLAGAGAYLAEVPAFVGASQGLDYLRAGRLTASAGDSLLGAGLFLGAMRFGSMLGMTLGNPAYSSLILPATSALGIYLGHRLEEGFELRPTSNEIDRWTSVWVTGLQMALGGRLMAEPLRQVSLPVSASLPFSIREVELLRSPLAAAPNDFGDDSPTIPNFSLMEAGAARLRILLGPRATPSLVSRAVELGEALQSPRALQDLLSHTQISDPAVLDVGLQRLTHMVEHSRVGGFRGSYLNWISRRGLERILRDGDIARFDEMLRFFHQGVDLPRFENFLGALFPSYRLVPASYFQSARRMPVYWMSWHPLHRQIRDLPLDRGARDLLHRFIDFQKDLPEDRIQLLHRAAESSPELRDTINRILLAARPSPISYLRVYRLLRLITNASNHLPKLAELASPGLSIRPATDLGHEGMRLNSEADAFMNDAELGDVLTGFYPRFTDYLHPERAAERRARGEAMIREIWANQNTLEAERVIRSFEELGDPISLSVAESLRSGRVLLRILPDAEYFEHARRHGEADRSLPPPGFFVGASEGLERDTMFVRQIRNVSRNVFPALVFQRLSTIVHEHGHYLRPPLRPRTSASARVEELIAVLRAVQWRAEHGDIERLRDYAIESPGGLAMALRDRVEGWYLIFPEPDM